MNINNKLLKNNISNSKYWNNNKRYENWYNNIFLKKYKNTNDLSKEEIIKLKKSFDKNLFEYFKYKKGSIYFNNNYQRIIYEGNIKKNLEKIYYKLYKRDLYNDIINRNKIFDNYLLKDYNILNNNIKKDYKLNVIEYEDEGIGGCSINQNRDILLDFSKFKLNENGSLITLNYNSGSSSGIHFKINQYSSITLVIKMNNEKDINCIILYELYTQTNYFYYSEPNWKGPYYYYTGGGNFNGSSYDLYNDNNLIMGVNGYADILNNQDNVHGTSCLFSNTLIKLKKM